MEKGTHVKKLARSEVEAFYKVENTLLAQTLWAELDVEHMCPRLLSFRPLELKSDGCGRAPQPHRHDNEDLIFLDIDGALFNLAHSARCDGIHNHASVVPGILRDHL